MHRELSIEEIMEDWDEWDRRLRENDIPDEFKEITGYDEEWKTIEGFPDYEVSIYGEIYSKRSGRLLSCGDNGSGYNMVVLCSGNKMHTKEVHILVAKAFIPNPNNKPEVNHKDGCKRNNRVTNLEWVTHKENMEHASRTGLIYRPENCGTPKKKVRIIETGEVFDSVSDCARYLGESTPNKTHISSCLSGRRKTHKGYHFEEVRDE